MNYYIVREGWPFIGGALAIFMIVMTIGNPALILLFGLLLAFVVWFFRNPERTVPKGEKIVASPADGKIIKVEKDLEGGTKISIFMSVLDVHVNRSPVSGIVKNIEYNKGKFLVASRDKASLDNEQNAVTVVDANGREIKFVQIAGLIARRIVCYLRPNDYVVMGERFGMIRFGSRVDVYLPEGFIPQVILGQKVKAGETIIGNYG